VTADWLVDSVASGRLLPESGYQPAPLAGHMPEAPVVGPPSGIVDASQHPWTKPTSQASKGSEHNIGHAMTGGGKLNKANSLQPQLKAGSKGKKRKFVMPSLQGTSLPILGDRAKPEIPEVAATDEAPADFRTEQVAAHSPKNIDSNSGRLSAKLDATQSHSPKDESLAQAMQHVSSLLAKVRHGQASSHQIDSLENRPSVASTGQVDPAGVRPGMNERRSRHQERRIAPSRPPSQPSHHDGDVFEVSQRVGYD